MAQEMITNYASKMDDAVSQAISNWWNGLTKEEILAYLADQPTITADTLRQLVANNNSVMAFDIRFMSANGMAQTDFHNK